ncbi:MAG: hypothetical protein ACSHW1_04635 [Yoonia sp.]|uniref:hypothetical protein n=1 Tax=Yoonia sp. TaxID=2212373 RepID=UPI003EF7B0A0
MQATFIRGVCAGLIVFGLTACGGGGGGTVGSGGGGSTSEPADEVPPGAGTPALSDRTATGSFDITYVVLEGQVLRRSGVTFDGQTGEITGQLLDGTDLDDNIVFTNPAGGEFSRIVRISGDSVFGVVGLDVPSGDLPVAGDVIHYNEGWVGLTAAFETDTLVLTGDATFIVDLTGGNSISGEFSNFNVESSAGSGAVSGSGKIIFTDGTISGANASFDAGTISGTGSFADLGGAGTTSSTTGTFFGPEADEFGGVVMIDDPNDDIAIYGAFQVD